MILFSLWLSLIVGGPVWASNDAAFTDYRKISDAGFPVETQLRRYSVLDPGSQVRIEQARRRAADEWDVLGWSWLKRLQESTEGLPPYLRKAFSTGVPQDPRLTLRLREGMLGVPIYVCSDNCPCPSGPSSSCAIGRRVGEVTATVLMLSRCEVRGEPCVSGEGRSQKKVQPRDSVRLMKEVLAQSSILQIFGPSAPLGAVEKISSELSDWGGTLGSVSCASPSGRGLEGRDFPAELLKNLKLAGRWKSLPVAWRECGMKLLSPILRPLSQFPSECHWVLDAGKWGRAQWQTLATSPLEVGRCEDDQCRTLTCHSREEGDRLVRFGEVLALELGSNSCDGSRPRKMSELYKSLLLPYVRDGVMQGGKKEEILSSCVRALEQGPAPQNQVPMLPPPLGSGTRAPLLQDSGVEVELLE